MCFRPAEVQMNICKECGKANKPIATVCEQCGAPLEKKMSDFDADQAKLDAAAVPPTSPASPGAPASSGAPKPPSAPSV